MAKIPELKDGNTLVNLASTFLEHFGATPSHPSIQGISSSLMSAKKVAVVLLDGLGYYVRRAHHEAAKLLIDREIATISSVNPATTVAATTAFLSGLYPKENGWLGWVSAFKDGNYLSFAGKNAATDSFDGTKHELPPYESIVEKINKAGHAAAFVYPELIGGPGSPRTFGEELEAVRRHFDDGKEFLYVYWTEPDHEIHDYGVESPVVDEVIRSLTEKLAAFVETLKGDEAVLVIADHGLVDATEVDMAEHPDLVALMSRGFSIEGRAASIFVKEGKEGEFAKLFGRYYPDIDLFGHEEVVNSDFFGTGKPNPIFDSLVGSFLAIPRGNKLLIDKHHYPHGGGFKGHHAGQSAEEKTIGVSLFAGAKR